MIDAAESAEHLTAALNFLMNRLDCKKCVFIMNGILNVAFWIFSK